MEKLELLAVVALLRDCPEYSLVRGQVGTIVENLTPNTYMVEFADANGRTYALVPLASEDLMRLHHGPLQQVA